MENPIVEQKALFEGLVYNEAGEAAQAVYIGGIAHYAIPDDGFLRHVEASIIDNAVLASIKEQITANQDLVIRGVLQMMGKDDLFSKAAIEASIRNMEQNIRQSNPDQWLPWLRFMGFRVVVNVHGEVVELIYPTQAEGNENGNDEGEGDE
ncbi:MAG: hypothetical protein ACYC6L_15900 [Anaerolineae bacterium]